MHIYILNSNIFDSFCNFRQFRQTILKAEISGILAISADYAENTVMCHAKFIKKFQILDMYAK